MKYVRIIDNNGIFLSDGFVDELTKNTIETPCQGGFYLPKWDGKNWVEGKSQEEIDTLIAQNNPQKSIEERIE